MWRYVRLGYEELKKAWFVASEKLLTRKFHLRLKVWKVCLLRCFNKVDRWQIITKDEYWSNFFRNKMPVKMKIDVCVVNVSVLSLYAVKPLIFRYSFLESKRRYLQLARKNSSPNDVPWLEVWLYYSFG